MGYQVGQDVRIKTWTAEKSAAKPVVHVVPAHTYGYDCNAGFSKWKLGWSDMKKVWSIVRDPMVVRDPICTQVV